MNARALDDSIAVLKQHKDVWARTPVARKVEYIEGVIRGYARLAAHQVDACNRAKGIASGSLTHGEEWAHPYLTVRMLRLLRDTLKQIDTTGRPTLPRGSVGIRHDGQVVVRVFPLSLTDALLYSGFRGEIRLRRGVPAEETQQHMAAFYRRTEPAGRVALVLGAGNVASVGPSDLAHKLFVEGQVALFKHNPVNEYLAPFLEEAWADPIRDGFLRTCKGGAEVGDYLCRHADIDEIHVTGSDRTYDAIVFGPGPEGTERKRNNEPRLTKRVTCELGNVSPLIVVPGPWSVSDIAFHAENIATQMIDNCGFNCLSTRVLITHRGWDRSEALMNSLRAVLAAAPQRPAYYPGAEKRFDEVMSVHPTAQRLGARSPGVLPYTVIPDLDAREGEDPCFASECFVPFLAQTALPGADAAEFLRNAVRFCNETLWGTLSAGVIVHPETERALGPSFEDAVAELRYGTVSINQWTALSYVLGSPSWGGFPGHVPTDIQSGIGTVHNTFMFDEPEKSVLRGPFRVRPKPPWFITHRKTGEIFARMVGLEAEPRLFTVLPIGLLALREFR
jgi:acyl-CoA reductase-like NAD-dependent aldehyde dehydrogenase